MTHSYSSRAFVTLLLFGLLAAPVMAGADAGEPGEAGKASVKGRVFGGSKPLAAATVFAYEVVSNAMKRVATDRYGHFLFGSLPAGMYQIVAYKQGFAPAVKPLLRRSPELHQFVDLRLKDETGDVRQAEGYWAVRSRIPTDVLREINTLIARHEEGRPGSSLDGASFAGQMLAHGGTEQLGAGQGEAQLTAAEVGLQGNLGDLLVELDGRYQQLSREGSIPDAAASSVALEIGGLDNDSKVTIAAANSHLAGLREGQVLPVGLERYQVKWSGRAGQNGHSGVRARYTEENNFHQPGWVTVSEIPDASRVLDVEGFYRGSLNEHTSLEAGLSYRQLDGEAASLPQLALGYTPLADEAIDLYGLAGSQIQPRVLVEYGLFSTVRDGGMSLMPHGGMVVQLGSSDWKARTSLSHRLEEERQEAAYAGFRSAFYSDRNTCRQAGEACYEVTFSRGSRNDDEISVGAVHRKFAETLRVYFSDDFFNRLESLFFVDGDTVPELKFRMVRHIAPRVLAKLESNFAAGGGGIFYATDALPYENQVRYLVTSLDTRFQQTSTGVFIAFHHLEQALDPIETASEGAAPEVEIQRLQLMLTQDLNVLADAAANWAVRFNFELSRGATSYTLTEDDELRKKLTGGLSVSF